MVPAKKDFIKNPLSLAQVSQFLEKKVLFLSSSNSSQLQDFNITLDCKSGIERERKKKQLMNEAAVLSAGLSQAN